MDRRVPVTEVAVWGHILTVSRIIGFLRLKPQDVATGPMRKKKTHTNNDGLFPWRKGRKKTVERNYPRSQNVLSSLFSVF